MSIWSAIKSIFVKPKLPAPTPTTTYTPYSGPTTSTEEEKEMKPKNILFLIIGILFFISLVSALSINYFSSPSCPACNSIKEDVQGLYSEFDYHNWNFYDTTKGSYNVQYIPTIRIKTDDCRNIELIGSDEINKYLKCELQEMSTLECPTHLELNRNSFFIK